MLKILDMLLDWLYPRRCTLCDCLLAAGERDLCPGCRKKVPRPIREPRCFRCGKPVSGWEQEFCYDCSKQKQSYDRGIGVFCYEGVMKASVMRFKFKGRKEYGDYLGSLMCRYAGRFIKEIQPEVILPVPIHRRKLSSRGYNQAEVLASVISKGFSIPIRTDLVLRRKFTKAQKELDRKERKKNLKQAFYVKKEKNQYKRVLLVDDIYTTGSTVNAIAAKLKDNGVKEVYFLTLCIGKGF